VTDPAGSGRSGLIARPGEMAVGHGAGPVDDATPGPVPDAAVTTGRERRDADRSPLVWLLAPAPAARLAVLRILVGGYATAWAAARLPAHLAHADQPPDRWQPVGVLAPLPSPLPTAVILAVALAAPLLGLLFIAGWRYRAVGPLFAAATLVLATLDSSWGQVFHTENLVVLHLVILALAPAAADTFAVGARARAPAPHGRYGWPVRLAALVVIVAYVLAGIAKLRIGGLDWIDGDTLRHLVAHDNLRKALLGDSYSPLGARAVGEAWLFLPLAVLTLLVELGAVVALLGGRWRNAWVAAAWIFHVGVLALMAIVFPYQLAGVAFAPLFRLERLPPALRDRGGGLLATVRHRP
jgi:hypothetical protein